MQNNKKIFFILFSLLFLLINCTVTLKNNKTLIDNRESIIGKWEGKNTDILIQMSFSSNQEFIVKYYLPLNGEFIATYSIKNDTILEISAIGKKKEIHIIKKLNNETLILEPPFKEQENESINLIDETIFKRSK